MKFIEICRKNTQQAGKTLYVNALEFVKERIEVASVNGYWSVEIRSYDLHQYLRLDKEAAERLTNYLRNEGFRISEADGTMFINWDREEQ
jgi:hypothetical protein